MTQSNKITYKFPREERLKSRISIDKLFEKKNQVKSYPLKTLYQIGPMDSEFPSHIQVSFSVPKRQFKSAVKRNYIKRRMLEAYRLNRNELKMRCEQKDLSLHMMIIYVSRDIPSYLEIERSVIKILDQLEKKL